MENRIKPWNIRREDSIYRISIGDWAFTSTNRTYFWEIAREEMKQMFAQKAAIKRPLSNKLYKRSPDLIGVVIKAL